METMGTRETVRQLRIHNPHSFTDHVFTRQYNAACDYAARQGELVRYLQDMGYRAMADNVEYAFSMYLKFNWSDTGYSYAAMLGEVYLKAWNYGQGFN